MNFVAISETNKRRIKWDNEGNASSYGSMKYLKYIGLQVKSVLWQLPVASFSSLSLFGVDLCSSPSWISSSNSSEQGFRFLPVCSNCFSAMALFVSVCFLPSFCLSTHSCADIWNASATRCRPSTASSCFLCSWEWLTSHLNLSVQLLPSQVSKFSFSVYTATWPASTKELADKVCLLGSAASPFWLMTSFEERGKKISKSGLLFSVSFS